MVSYKRAGTKYELQQILELQQYNLSTYLSEEECLREGFVTISHSFDLLKKMNDVCPHIIAKDENKVIGYALCMHPQFSEEIDLLKPMFQALRTIFSKHEKYIVMGQICIAKDYRKMGIFRSLYHTMKEVLEPEFKSIVTEVNRSNQRSLNAHYSIGFRHLKTHKSKGRSWELIVLK